MNVTRYFRSSARVLTDFKLSQRPQTRKISSIHHQSHDPRMVHGSFPIGGKRWSYPSFWLRDHCQCGDCKHPETKQRLLDTFSIPKDIAPKEVVGNVDGVLIEWSHDGHKSFYPFAWMKAHPFSSGNFTPSQWKHWNELETGNEPEIQYQRIMDSLEGVRSWTNSIQKYGYCYVKDVPTNPEATKALLERIAFIRVTHYGGFWDFTSDLSSKDTAYTNLGLPLHTDTAYFTDPCGLQLFHLLSHEADPNAEQSDEEDLGGHNTMCDGYAAAAHMKKHHRSEFHTLCYTPIPFHASGNEDVSITPASHFAVFTRHKRSLQIRWNNDDRATKSDWDTRTATRWYEAARIWHSIINSPEFFIETKFTPGRALIFDNWRMLHGRTAFTGKRRMCGGYISHDDFWSRYMLLNYGREYVLNSV